MKNQNRIHTYCLSVVHGIGNLLYKSSFFLLFVFNLTESKAITVTYTVTSYQDFITNLSLGIADANTNSNDIIIQLVNTGNLILPATMTLSVPQQINLFHGSLTITKSTGNVAGFSGTNYSGSAIPFIDIGTVRPGCFVRIEGIHFESFHNDEIIRIEHDAYNVTITANSFDQNLRLPSRDLWCIASYSAREIDVDENIFTDSDNGIKFRIIDGISEFHQVSVSLNKIFFSATNFLGIFVENLYQTANVEMEISGNKITYGTDAITILNSSASFTATPLLSLHILSNTIENSKRAFCLTGANKTWEFNGNVTKHITDDDFYISTLPGASAINKNVFGLDLIGTNSLGYLPINNTNTFGPSSSLDFFADIPGYYGKGIKIIGLDVQGSIRIHSGTTLTDPYNRVTIRQCKVKATTPDKPIEYDYDDYFPEIDVSGIINCNNIMNITMSVVPQSGFIFDPHFRHYVIDFYTSNTAGSLVDYIGSYPVNNCAILNHTFFLPVPQGVIVNNNSRLATTITSLGDAIGTVSIGTSPAYYTAPGIISTCCCTDLNIAVAAPSVQPNAPYIFSCVNQEITMVPSCTGGSQNSYDWTVTQNSQTIDQHTGGTYSYTFAAEGLYTVSVTANGSSCNSSEAEETIYISNCTEIPCDQCLSSFAPTVETNYVISAWTKEANAVNTTVTYEKPQIEIYFVNVNAATNLEYTFHPEGAIIDGWQRIEEQFTIPADANEIKIRLMSNTSENVFFDDVRIFPANGSMKSYVYDPENLRFVAELDERNYATFYEYDESGMLIRTKKETERGIMTLKESRNNSVLK